MAASFCLIRTHADNFKKGLKDGSINPVELAAMTSADRHAYLTKFVGEENATQVNGLFESKLLLKNQKAGYIAWAKRVGNISPKVQRDLIARIEKLDKVLNPEEEAQFLNDLASTKLGVEVTQEEAKTIADLSKKVTDSKALLDSGGDRLEYGKAKVQLLNYVNDLKTEANKTTLFSYVKNPKDLGQGLSKIAGNAKSLKASLDNSALFRQGWKTAITNPMIWQKNARQSFTDMYKTFGGKAVADELNADMLSRPNAVNGKYRTMKLAVGTVEEAFPESIGEKVPVIKKLFKASESAYTGFLHRQRADIADKYLEIAEKSGVDTTDKHQLESIGKLVNSLTGRGNLGKLEPVAGVINNVFFSPRSLKANIDVLTAHTFDDVSGFARKQAAINLLKIVSASAAVLGIAKVTAPDSVELDPRSSDFGKIKVGNTRFDVTGGSASIVTLAARLITSSSKSTTTHKVNPLNSDKFGSQTKRDVIDNFFDNKLSPVASVVNDLFVRGTDFAGNKPTLLGEVSNLATPLPITTAKELLDDPNSANTLVAMIADALGIAVNDYSSKKGKK